MPTSNQIFTESQRALLTAALNRIVPAEGKMPGAGDIGVAEFVENFVSGDPRRRRLTTDGLAQIEIVAAQQSGKEFTELNADEQEAVLKDVQAQQPVFFDFLVRQCYNGYYTNPEIQDLVGYHCPSPGDYEYKPLDESLLEPQRRRAPFWTQV